MYYHTGRLSLLLVIVLYFLSAVSGLTYHATPSTSHWDEMLVKHRWNATPEDWVSLGHPPNGTTIGLHIALNPNRENALIDALYEVSHPRHPKYGAHLSRDQVYELVAPHPETLELVYSWLKYNGVPPSSISKRVGGSWLTVAGVPVSRANELLGASYQVYRHSRTNETILRTIGYALPPALHMHVKTIAPTTAFTSTRHLQQTPRSPSGRESANATLGEPTDLLSRRDPPVVVTPSVLRSRYEIFDGNPAARDRNVLGIAGFGNERPDNVDEWLFMKKFRTNAVGESPSASSVYIIPVNGGVDAQSPPGARGNLDTQYSLALAHPTPVALYTVGGGQNTGEQSPPSADRYVEWLLFMNDQKVIPQTISVPYFTKELDIPKEYADPMCIMFAELGSRGSTILVASGDDGVGRPGDCIDSSGNIRFYTVFPASCPYVTSVGGTRGFPEKGALNSGGGFSRLFPRDSYHNSYQSEVVNRFLDQFRAASTDPYLADYNPMGRGVPDIAVQSMDYEFYVNRGIYVGTSTAYSTNTAAAIFALLNDYRLFQKRETLGWVNLLLYDVIPLWESGGLKDIIGGNNGGCGTMGFYAISGWDPVTGLGSLNYLVLETALEYLP